MVQTTARFKKNGKNFEIIVDMEKAIKFKKEESNDGDFLEIDKIFNDSKKGFNASSKDLEDAFGTEDIKIISETIVKNGEILTNQDYRDEEKEKKFKQIVEFLSSNAIDPQTKNPHTPARIESGLKQLNINIRKEPIENQIKEIVEKLNTIFPIKIKTKKVKILVPAMYTGKIYNLINNYKEKEKWLDNGDLEVIASIPSGNILFSFYEKLNSETHGSVLTEEIENESEN